MPIKGEKGIDIKPGHYTGVLKNPQIVERYKDDDGKKTPVYYLEIDAHTKDRESVLKASWPANLTPQTGLGRLLTRLGIQWEVDEDFDESTLHNIVVEYNVVKDGHFVRINPDSIKPVE